jgi:oligosaccharide repeat unit polymerase
MLFLVKKVISRALVGLLALSVFGGYLVGQPLDLFDAETNFYSLFTCFALFLLFIPFNLQESMVLANTHLHKYRVNNKLVILVITLSCLAVMLNLYAFYKSLANLLSSSLSIADYKNLGHSEDFILSSIPTVFRFFSNLFSPLSYICLAIHFYSIICQNKKQAIFSLIGALNIAIIPLFHFARGGVLTFCVLYVCLFAVVFRYLSSRNKKQVIRTLIILVAPVFCAFIYISIDRFSDYPYYREGTWITNQAIFASFDYLSQWMVNGNTILSLYSSDKIIFASNFSYIPGKIVGLFGVTLPELQIQREFALSGYENHFNGLVALWVYDFGFIGAILVCFIYFFIAKSTVKTKSNNPLSLLIRYVLLLPIPIFFFQASFTVFGFYNVAIIYSIIFIYMQRLRWKR